jgi:uncharacterized integral membrane protein
VKKLGYILLAIVAVIVGLLVGTLNSDYVQLNLLWIQPELPLGLTILIGFSLGLVTGLVTIYFVRVLPLRLQLRKSLSTLMKYENDAKQEVSGKQQTSEISLPDD